ncbi:uncharacterized protein LOC132123053 [Carassius carassius]|uniref:uncharacterized protein LOC132123053 n=1 Tax=Carassius carassius TaxID=217509 RepID=UPI00286892B4|nr:uncharacterized protein LOC132123053 [Carassius carassius]
MWEWRPRGLSGMDVEQREDRGPDLRGSNERHYSASSSHTISLHVYEKCKAINKCSRASLHYNQSSHFHCDRAKSAYGHQSTGQDEQPARENSSDHNNNKPSGQKTRLPTTNQSRQTYRSLSSMNVIWRNYSTPVLVNGGPAALHSPGLLLRLKMASETDPLPHGLKTEINTLRLHTDGETTPQPRSEMLKAVVGFLTPVCLCCEVRIMVWRWL